MAHRGITTTFTMTLIFVSVMADPSIIMLTPSESIRRTDWESMNGGGWAPAPMPAPKIILLKNEENAESGGDKEDKLASLMPLIMSIGPLILVAILLPVFMSLLSGIMGFVKSLLSMKMPMMNMMPVMPVMNMLPNGLNGMNGINGINGVNGIVPQGIMDVMQTMQKPILIAGRKHNSTFGDRFPMKVDDMVLARNVSAFRIPGI